MPICEGRIYREPDGQYSWLYFKDSVFQDVGGANVVGLSTAVNQVRDRIAAEANVGQSKFVTLIADIP